MGNPLNDPMVREVLVESGLPNSGDADLHEAVNKGADLIEHLLALRTFKETPAHMKDPLTPDQAILLVRMMESPRFLAQCNTRHRAVYVQSGEDERLNLPKKIRDQAQH